MVFAAASHAAEFEIESLYREMVREDQENPASSSPALSQRALRRGQKELAKRESLHVLAGEVVLEIARLNVMTGKTPSLNAARRLVAFNHRQFQRKAKDSLMERSVLREVERGFAKYQNIAHIRAALHYILASDGEIEAGEYSFRRLLGIARTFEGIIDRIEATGPFSWMPLRIPPQIECVLNLHFAEMTAEELAAAGHA